MEALLVSEIYHL